MHTSKHLAWLLIVCCMLLCALYGVACAFNDDPGVALGPANDPSPSADETVCALPVLDARRLATGPVGCTSIAGPALLAAAPGGLCLLI